MSPHQFEMFDVGEVTVVRYSYTLKYQDGFQAEENAQHLREHLRWMIEEMGRKYILLTLEKIDFYYTSVAIGQLVRLPMLFRPVQGKLVVSGLPKQLLELFQLLRLDKLLPCTQTEEEGLRLFDLPKE